MTWRTGFRFTTNSDGVLQEITMLQRKLFFFFLVEYKFIVL